MKRPFVHYDPASGAIHQLSSRAFDVPGWGAAYVLDAPDTIDGARHKVDLQSVVHGFLTPFGVCRLVEMSSAERPAPILFTTIEGLKQTRNARLADADAMMLPHRPVDPALRAAWVGYMQALRDLGAHKTVESFVVAWPVRPDDIDDIAHIRARVLVN